MLGCQLGECFKPVILVHGVNSDGKSLDDLKSYIIKAHPGTNVTALELYDFLASFAPLPDQLPVFIKKVRPLMQEAPEGVILICHSQGGMICRGIIEKMNDHNVDTVIALSSPLLGQFGVPPEWSKHFPILQNKTRDDISRLAYTNLFQAFLSVANYWRDPRPQYYQAFEKYCRYLALLDNNPKAADYDPKYAATQKNNFLKIKRMVLLGGPNDGVINPWQSSLFSYLDYDGKTMKDMQQQEMYVQDWFGLRSLDKRGGLIRYSVPSVDHEEWHHNITVFERYIKKWLT